MTDSGEVPFKKWHSKLNKVTGVIVRKYIDRVANGGSTKNIKSLQDGVFEIKVNYGSGYRVYFAEEKGCIILLLLGGDKGSQKSDVLKTKVYWSRYVQKK